MIPLHYGTGSTGFDVLGDHTDAITWSRMKENVSRLLKARKLPGAGLLARLPWELRDGTNYFHDEFCVLYACLPIDEYVTAAELEKNADARKAAKSLVDAFAEIGTSIRFVGFEPDIESTPVAVSAPIVRTDAATVNRALQDAERLLQSNGAVSAVDRVHTAIHGYSRQICSDAGIDPGEAGTTTALWKRIKTSHPSLATHSEHSDHVQRIVSAIATILDAMNPVRNNASVAHPNDVLLSEAEAMLVLNAGRTILHYLEATTRG